MTPDDLLSISAKSTEPPFVPVDVTLLNIELEIITFPTPLFILIRLHPIILRAVVVGVIRLSISTVPPLISTSPLYIFC